MAEIIKQSRFTRAGHRQVARYRSKYKVVNGQVTVNKGRPLAVVAAFEELNSKGLGVYNKSERMPLDLLHRVGISVQNETDVDYNLMREEDYTLENKNIRQPIDSKSTEMTEEDMNSISPNETDPIYTMDDSPPNYVKKQRNVRESFSGNRRIEVLDVSYALTQINREARLKAREVYLLKEFREMRA